MRSRSRSRRLCAPLAALLALGALPALASTPLVHRVSDLGIATGDVAATPAAAAPRFSPDGEWAVWTQDALVNEGWNLYAARRWEGSAPVLLSSAYPAGHGLIAFAVTPDSRRVVYLAGTFASGLFELLSAPIDGAAPAVVLSPSPPAGGGVVDFALTPDGSRAVLLGDLRVTNQFELWSVPVAGPAGDADRLNPNPATAGQDVEAFAVSPDSQRVAFTGVLRGNGFDEVWSAPLAGPPPSTPVSPVGSAGAVGVALSPALPLAFSNDSARVLFAGDFQTPGTVQLWTNTNTGGQGAADTLNPPPATGGDVVAFALAPGTARAVFLGDLLVDDLFELFSAPVDGSAFARLSPFTMQAAGDVTDFVIGPGTSPQVYYRADATTDQAFDLYRSPIAGGAAVALSPSGVATRSLESDFAPAPDGSRVVFRGNFDTAGKIELYSAPGTGASGSASRISRAATPAGASVEAFAIASTSATVVYAGDLQTAGRSELWSVPIAGGASAKLHPDAGANENVTAFALAPGGADAAFLADLVVNDRFDLWVAPLSGPAPAAPVAVTAVTSGDVALPLVWSGEGHGVLFPGDLETDERFLLWDADTLIFGADFEEGDDSEWSAAVP